MDFFKRFLASCLGSVVGIGFLLFLILFGIIGISSSSSISNIEKSKIEENSVLDLNLDVAIRDRGPKTSVLELSLEISPKAVGLNQILGSIIKAKKDNKIKGISLNSDFINAGWVQTQEIRDALKDFKDSGKFVYAYSNFFSQKGYYLASIADSIFMSPLGIIEFKGLSSEILYYDKFQKKYGLKYEVIRKGEYKSAVEPYLQDKMSDENKAQIEEILFTVWETIASEISESRNLSIEELNFIADNLLATTSKEALEKNFIDKIVHEDDYKKSIKNVLGILDPKELNLVDFKKLNSKLRDYDIKVKDKIAIIYAQGTILYEKGNETTIGEELFKKTIEELGENENIKAVVLRINSPGGDALTSEILWNSIEKLKKNKPIVVSMGNVAASGGYYIACNADKILANPMTITGSIGVWAMIPNLEGISSNIGINAEQVNTHKNSMGYSLFEPLQSGYKNAMERAIDQVYNLFKSRVSEGRTISLEEVENYAKGHVWTGKEAKEIGLIDQIGGLQDAIYEASQLAKIENFNIVEYPIVEEDFESILTEIFPSIKLLDNYKKIKDITNQTSRLKSFENLQTLIPYKVNIK
ncbi:MAG: signal peptide peptidase SppA [Bacteroidota bacterium]|nr:signal peptide peptidase SppA [Bacteroidota bacterium]